MSVAKAIFWKEVREVLRDKRTLFLALVLPLLFYPVLMGVTMMVAADKPVEGDRVRVAFHRLPDDFQKTKKLNWIETKGLHESEMPDGISVGVDYDGKVFRLFHTVGQEQMAALVVSEIRAYQDSIVYSKLVDAGMEMSMLDGSRIERVSVALSPEVLKKQLGSAGAYFMIFLAFTGCMAVAVDAGAGERERGTMEAMMATPASFYGVSLGKFMFVLLMGLASVVATFCGMGTMLLVDEKLKKVSSEILGFESIVMLGVLMVGVVVFFSSMLYCISLRAKSSREAHLRSSMIMMILAVLLILCGAPRVSQSLWVDWIPIMNVAVLIPKILVGSATWVNFIIPLLTSWLFAGLFIFIVSYLYRASPESSYLGESS